MGVSAVLGADASNGSRCRCRCIKLSLNCGKELGVIFVFDI